ncbi:MAG TPA: hypothetical protein VN442_01925 [Bryobacteraceae bacterium]|nr:hypothetical protein [Bryobacteraceae bacterium]
MVQAIIHERSLLQPLPDTPGIALGADDYTSGRVGQNHLGAGYSRAALIADNSRDSGNAGLAECDAGQSKARSGNLRRAP